MAAIHLLKVAPQFWGALSDGRKTAEARLDDRGFTVGDFLELREYDGGFHHRAVWARITHILRDSDGPWLQPGYVMLSFERTLPPHLAGTDA